MKQVGKLNGGRLHITELESTNEPLQCTAPNPHNPCLIKYGFMVITDPIYCRLFAQYTAQKWFLGDVIFTIIAKSGPNSTTSRTEVWSHHRQEPVYYCVFYVLHKYLVDYQAYARYNTRDYLSNEPRESGGYHGPQTKRRPIN